MFNTKHFDRPSAWLPSKVSSFVLSNRTLSNASVLKHKRKSNRFTCDLGTLLNCTCVFIVLTFIVLVVYIFIQAFGLNNSTNVSFERQNYYRSIYGSQLLTRDPILTDKAVETVNDLVSKFNRNRFVEIPFFESAVCTFRKSFPYAVDLKFSGFDMAEAFYTGHTNYNYTTNACNSGPNGTIDHRCHCFTQMIWNSTNLVGCAVKKHDNNTFYAACAYEPGGNIPGKYKSNVPKFDGVDI